jgi:hypothetical protein
MALIVPAQIPPMYKNTIEDLLLAIINTLPVPSGNPAQFLNGQYNWVNGTSGTGTLPLGVTAIEDVPTNTSQIHFTQGTNIVFDCLLGTNSDDGITAYLGAGPDDGLMVYNGKFRVGKLIITQAGGMIFPAFAAPSSWSPVIDVDNTDPLHAQIKISNLGHASILNNVANAQVEVFSRNTAGTDAVLDLFNIGEVRLNNIKCTSSDGFFNIDTLVKTMFKINGVLVAGVRSNYFGPVTDNAYDLGAAIIKWRTVYSYKTETNIFPAQPTTVELPASNYSMCKIAGVLYLVANDAGVIKKVALT